MEALNEVWTFFCECYQYYSTYVHYIFPREVGDLAEAVIDIAVAFMLVKVVARGAFHTRGGE